MAINYSLVKLASKFGDKTGVPKFYARAQMNESISLKKFAKLISMQTTVFLAFVPSWGIAICLAFRKPVRVLMPRSSSTCWMLPDSLPSRGLFASRNPLNLFNKLGRIAIRCALFLCRHISFTQHSTLNIQHSTFNTQHSLTFHRNLLQV